jgi:tRNA threonylcarbamoyladenosine biosynthesis protein TsaB
MARIVALDTTSEFGSVALVENGAVLREALLHAPDGFGHVLFPELLALVAAQGWDARHVDCFAAASGPGSFTGVRIGLAAAKGLAEAAGVKAAGISNLRAMAWHGRADLRAPVLDARRGQVYGAVYGQRLDPVQSEVVMTLEDWLAGLPAGDIEFLAQDPAPFAEVLRGRRLEIVPRALAGAIGVLAEAEPTDPALVDANYVRRSDAELFWKEA